MKHESIKLAIVGAGAAGLFAAAEAARRRVPCIVIERKARIGAKMLMTANGRCNFTKDIPVSRMLEDIGGEVASFVRPALEACTPQAIARFFRSHGLKIKRMNDSRLFPASEKAADVVHIFGDLLREERIPLLTNSPVTGIQRVKNGFIVGMENFTLWAENVLLATGGVSFPKTGSVGDAQRFAAAMGHRIEPMRAGLTGYDWPLCPPPRRITGARAAIVAGGRELVCATGEVEFAKGLVSGAAVYNCSRYVARRGLDARQYILEISTPDGEKFSIPHPVMRPLKEAIVTIGGVSRDDIDPATMASRIVPGLYFAGEAIDIDGPTGGYNLSLAFATAALCVQSIAAS